MTFDEMYSGFRNGRLILTPEFKTQLAHEYAAMGAPLPMAWRATAFDSERTIENELAFLVKVRSMTKAGTSERHACDHRIAAVQKRTGAQPRIPSRATSSEQRQALGDEELDELFATLHGDGFLASQCEEESDAEVRPIRQRISDRARPIDDLDWFRSHALATFPDQRFYR